MLKGNGTPGATDDGSCVFDHQTIALVGGDQPTTLGLHDARVQGPKARDRTPSPVEAVGVTCQCSVDVPAGQQAKKLQRCEFQG